MNEEEIIEGATPVAHKVDERVSTLNYDNVSIQCI